MKKQKKRPVSKTKRQSRLDATQYPDMPGPSRRSVLLKLRNGAIAVAIISGAGWVTTSHVSAVLDEHDLSRIGNGTPVVVQIHDPQCALCVALQREARSALSDFKDDELQFVVANIKTTGGSRLAARHGVGHVTLLLFDGNGKVRSVLAGSNNRAFLRTAFTNHLAAFRAE